MNVQQLKRLETSLLFNYPLLREPGMYKPAAKGRTILSPGQVLALFDGKDDADYLIGVAIYVTAKKLSEVFKDKRFSDAELPAILNQHFDFAELMLLHHSKRLPGLYDENVEGIEDKRGEYLGQLADAEDSLPVGWTEYAYWLLGRADKVTASDETAAATYHKEAETYLRKAHRAGYTEATEALATLIYTSSDNVGEAVFYWEKAASTGNVIAIQNLTNVVIGDDRLMAYERIRSLSYVWQGIASNKKETKDVAASLKQAGLCVPAAPETALIPA